jgi:hypothetical protein
VRSAGGRVRVCACACVGVSSRLLVWVHNFLVQQMLADVLVSMRCGLYVKERRFLPLIVPSSTFAHTYQVRTCV